MEQCAATSIITQFSYTKLIMFPMAMKSSLVLERWHPKDAFLLSQNIMSLFRLRTATFCFFLCLLTILNLQSFEADATSAFTNSPIGDVQIFIELPEGYYRSSQVGLLLKSLYGLKQAARDWFMMLISLLIKCGLVQSEHDPCFFYKKNKRFLEIIYVDNIIVGYSTQNEEQCAHIWNDCNRL